MPTSTQSIREIVSTQSSAAAVLERFDIDLCSHANESLKQACAELQLSVDQVLEKLSDAAANEPGAQPTDLASYSMSRLVQHIVRTHHRYVRRELPRLTEMAHKVAGNHSERSPELERIERLLDELQTEMFAYLEKEERVLFPFIAEMDQYAVASSSPSSACFLTVAQPIRMMMLEHDAADRIIEELRSLSDEFGPPKWACGTYVAFYGGLRAFKADFRQHVHLENDVLFPRAIEMESALRRKG
jgi:regulator of cell morphogenesis and NO signaling